MIERLVFLDTYSIQRTCCLPCFQSGYQSRRRGHQLRHPRSTPRRPGSLLCCGGSHRRDICQWSNKSLALTGRKWSKRIKEYYKQKVNKIRKISKFKLNQTLALAQPGGGGGGHPSGLTMVPVPGGVSVGIVKTSLIVFSSQAF